MGSHPPRYKITPEQRREAIAAVRPDVMRTIPLHLRLWWTIKSQKFNGKAWQDFFAEKAVAMMITEIDKDLKSAWLAERGELDRDLIRKLYKAQHGPAFDDAFWWRRR